MVSFAPMRHINQQNYGVWVKNINGFSLLVCVCVWRGGWRGGWGALRFKFGELLLSKAETKCQMIHSHGEICSLIPKRYHLPLQQLLSDSPTCLKA